MIDAGSEDPEERRKRIEAEQNGADLGTVLGLAIGVISALTQEERQLQEEEETNEYYIEEETTTWQQSM